jgi:hypothetical protein
MVCCTFTLYGIFACRATVVVCVYTVMTGQGGKVAIGSKGIVSDTRSIPLSSTLEAIKQAGSSGSVHGADKQQTPPGWCYNL